MSQLIHIRQRLKAVATIKKITSAMRIISRSLHTRMNKEKKNLLIYQETIATLLKELQSYQTSWNNNRFFPTKKQPQKKLFIFVGAQKGLCGNYNTEIEYFLLHKKSELNGATIISIGNKTTDLLKKHTINVKHHYPELKNSSIGLLSERLTSFILDEPTVYTSVKIISSQPKNFFSHQLEQREIVPFETPKAPPKNDYLWHNKPEDILNSLGRIQIKNILYSTLFMSLLGEQAARFIAMDNATRNADNFIDSLALEYNKIRQAKITRELTELSANFS